MIYQDEIPFWMPFEGKIPKRAVKAGKECDQTVFIGRAVHNGSLTPGKILSNEIVCKIPWGTISNSKEDFEILVNSSSFNWVAAENGSVPQNAFPGGHSEGGETIYIGRVKHESGALIVGKIEPSHGVCYIAFELSELNYRKYEVYVV